jgi:hypothetical protein
MSTIVILWFCIVYLAAHPLTDAPVEDSWVYEHAVTHFNRTGTIQFPGFTQAIPVAQVFYGVAWSRVLGETSRSLDISTALLAGCGKSVLEVPSDMAIVRCDMSTGGDITD